MRLRWALAALLAATAVQAQPPPPDRTPAPQTSGTGSLATAPGPAPAGLRGAAPARRPAATAPGIIDAGDLNPPLPPMGLQGGGDPAPLCRARCASALYTCVSEGSADGSCHVSLGVCRRGCDALTIPSGRLQSPLPAAGLAPVGSLRPLPGGLPALQ